MKIECPVTKSYEVKLLAREGADIFYCGILPEGWINRYSTIAPPNRKEELISQVKNLEEFKKIIEISKSYNKPVYVTFNSPLYTSDQYPSLEKLVDKLISLGTDGFIISDISFLRKIAEEYKDIKLIVSTAGGVFNTESCLFYKELGATGITLPYSITLEEIKSIARNVINILELSVFVLNENHWGINAYCTFAHGIGEVEVPCKRIYKITDLGNSNRVWQGGIDTPPNNRHCIAPSHPSTGLDSLWEFKKIGIHTIKFSGRYMPLEGKLMDLQFINKARNFLKESTTEYEYKRKVEKLFFDRFGRKMTLYDCYYPKRE